MEALIAASVLEANSRGLREMSLGLVLDLEDSELRPPAALGTVFGWLQRLDRNGSLGRFKEKLVPRWEAR